jgi:16S rRNA (cytidine1402-2'-O)-methyltransferase
MSLFITSTPIGNLKDITFRAVETLESVDLILAEDTRRTRLLCNHYDITTPMESYNDHNKESITPTIINRLRKNKSIALVSDSGTPCISDPGFYLVREALKSKIPVHSIPGPTASIAALTISGLPTDKFLFLGFPPKKEKAKEEFFKKIKATPITTILYESPHRIEKTLNLIAKILPNAQIALARELTKKFEDCIRGTAKELEEKCKEKPIKGEITLIVKNE